MGSPGVHTLASDVGPLGGWEPLSGPLFATEFPALITPPPSSRSSHPLGSVVANHSYLQYQMGIV